MNGSFEPKKNNYHFFLKFQIIINISDIPPWGFPEMDEDVGIEKYHWNLIGRKK